jgi:hypothetical protein
VLWCQIRKVASIRAAHTQSLKSFVNYSRNPLPTHPTTVGRFLVSGVNIFRRTLSIIVNINNPSCQSLRLHFLRFLPLCVTTCSTKQTTINRPNLHLKRVVDLPRHLMLEFNAQDTIMSLSNFSFFKLPSASRVTSTAPNPRTNDDAVLVTMFESFAITGVFEEVSDVVAGLWLGSLDV